jgi:excisionase family DNA binding protein
VKQAADEFGIPDDSLRKLITNKKLPAVELPGIRRVLIDRADLETAILEWKRL